MVPQQTSQHSTYLTQPNLITVNSHMLSYYFHITHVKPHIESSYVAYRRMSLHCHFKHTTQCSPNNRAVPQNDDDQIFYLLKQFRTDRDQLSEQLHIVHFNCIHFTQFTSSFPFHNHNRTQLFNRILRRPLIPQKINFALIFITF